jgi:hypothetical protein
LTDSRQPDEDGDPVQARRIGELSGVWVGVVLATFQANDGFSAKRIVRATISRRPFICRPDQRLAALRRPSCSAPI